MSALFSRITAEASVTFNILQGTINGSILNADVALQFADGLSKDVGPTAFGLNRETN